MKLICRLNYYIKFIIFMSNLLRIYYNLQIFVFLVDFQAIIIFYNTPKFLFA